MFIINYRLQPKTYKLYSSYCYKNWFYNSTKFVRKLCSMSIEFKVSNNNRGYKNLSQEFIDSNTYEIDLSGNSFVNL